MLILIDEKRINVNDVFKNFPLMNKLQQTIQFLLQKLSGSQYMNRGVIFCIDLLLSVSATLMVSLLLFDFLYRDLDCRQLCEVGVLSALSSAIALYGFKLYASVIRHSTLREAWRIGAVAFIKVAFMSILYNGLCDHCSLRVGLLLNFSDFLVTIVLLVFFRILLLNLYNLLMLAGYKRHKQILIYGTGDAAVSMVSGTQSTPFLKNYQIKGFVTTQTGKRHYRIAGLSVYQVSHEEDLISLVRRQDIDGILFPNIRMAQQEQDRLVKFCTHINLRTLLVPDTEEMRDGKVQRSIRHILIEDLLGREEIQINIDEIEALLEGKTVLVTGAAGSIGSEICRQLARFHLHSLVLLDNAETPMHNLRLELEESFSHLSFVPVIGDVRNSERLEYVFRSYRPQVVFHAAAYKHVPLMEENPCEAVRVNVMGTRNVADFSVKYAVERFVMVSTDKAVNPTNIMGCTKRLAEIYVQSLSVALCQGKLQGSTKFITTRFGNVLGSNGSVIPRFREQIKNGGPVTVTHPDIIRYFMTIPEACRLVLEAGTMGEGGEIFIFDMGEPVKIADLARRMIRLAGFVPDQDIAITYTGLRPGEKLYEELLSNEENTKPTVHRKIRVAAVREYEYEQVCPLIEQVTDLALHVEISAMVKAMKELVPEFKSKNSRFEELDK